MGFSNDFIWGAASASYQVEGASKEHGKGLNIWDVTSTVPGRVAYDENGDVSTDHYHRFREDVKLFKEMGLKAYRFSIAWARVLPEGTGEVNEEGLQFYSDLVDALLEEGIEPIITLFHWDLPYSIYLKGGYGNPDFPSWFAYFTKIVVDRLSNRVKYWITINEPQCIFGNGYINGTHAPFLQVDDRTVLIMVHNLLKAHGRAVQTIREFAKTKPLIGIAPMGPVVLPENDSPEAIAEAEYKTFALPEDRRWRLYNIALFSDPMILGRYPDDYESVYGEAAVNYTQEDMELINQPLDFYGDNVYFTAPAGMNGSYPVDRFQGASHSDMDWRINEDSIYWSARFMYDRYRLPLMITENGVAVPDCEFMDGKVHDPLRIDYMHRYIKRLRDAADDGVPVIGYLYWSAMDNYEWALGYDKRFGLIYVNYQTLQRTIKDSAYWYRQVIESNGENL